MIKPLHAIALSLAVSVISIASGQAQSTASGVPAYANPSIPGATGETIVKGNNSTIAGTRDASRQQRYFQQSIGQEADRSNRAATSSPPPVATEQR